MSASLIKVFLLALLSLRAKRLTENFAGYGVSIKVPTKMLSALRSLPDSALGRGPSGRQVVLPEAFLCTRQLKASMSLQRRAKGP